MITKGGVGSGIRGHRTIRDSVAKLSPSVKRNALDRLKGEQEKRRKNNNRFVSDIGNGIWKIEMSVQEANKFSAKSKIKIPVFHGTTVDNAKGIRKEGFLGSKIGSFHGNCGFYGRGFYFTGIRKEGEEYASQSSVKKRKGELLELRLNVKNVCDTEQWKKLNKKYNFDKMLFKDLRKGPDKIRDILEGLGYDAVEYKFKDFDFRSHEICVFNPKNVVVVKK